LHLGTNLIANLSLAKIKAFPSSAWERINNYAHLSVLHERGNSISRKEPHYTRVDVHILL
jgi:hypothetical protein